MSYILRKARWLANNFAAGIFYALSFGYINFWFRPPCGALMRPQAFDVNVFSSGTGTDTFLFI